MTRNDETKQLTALQALERLTGVHSQVILPEDGPDDASVVSPATPELKGKDRRTQQYQILGELARGGVGVILKGHDVDLGRDLAMKILREDHKDSPAMIQRFVEEA